MRLPRHLRVDGPKTAGLSCPPGLTACGSPAATRRPAAAISFLLEAGTLAPRSYLGPDDGDRRFLAGEPRRLNRLLAPFPFRSPAVGVIRRFITSH